MLLVAINCWRYWRNGLNHRLHRRPVSDQEDLAHIEAITGTRRVPSDWRTGVSLHQVTKLTLTSSTLTD